MTAITTNIQTLLLLSEFLTGAFETGFAFSDTGIVETFEFSCSFTADSADGFSSPFANLIKAQLHI